MKINLKILSLLFSYIIVLSPISIHGQSSDEKSIDYSYTQLQFIFKILKIDSRDISQSCLESLKKLHNFKNQLSNSNDINDKDLNNAILRSLYNNAYEFCKVDALSLCNHQVPSFVRLECRKLRD